NQGEIDAVILGLYVVGDAVDFDIGVVTEEHSLGLHSDKPSRQQKEASRSAFDRLRVNRYYTALPMSGSGLQAYGPLVLQLLIAFVLASLLVTLSAVVGWRRPNRAKQQAYECGMEPTGDAREPFSVKFYLVAMVFILFDVEAIFLYPWAYVFR